MIPDYGIQPNKKTPIMSSETLIYFDYSSSTGI